MLRIEELSSRKVPRSVRLPDFGWADKDRGPGVLAPISRGSRCMVDVFRLNSRATVAGALWFCLNLATRLFSF
jgi:hypothetical protein